MRETACFGTQPIRKTLWKGDKPAGRVKYTPRLSTIEHMESPSYENLTFQIGTKFAGFPVRFLL